MPNRYINPSDETDTRKVIVGDDVEGMSGLYDATTPLKFPDYEVDPANPDVYDPIESEQIQLTENVYSADGYHEEHEHTDLTQVYYFLSGTTEVTVGDETETVEAGSVAYIPAGTSHSTRVIGDEDVRLLIISIPVESE